MLAWGTVVGSGFVERVRPFQEVARLRLQPQCEFKDSRCHGIGSFTDSAICHHTQCGQRSTYRRMSRAWASGFLGVDQTLFWHPSRVPSGHFKMQKACPPPARCVQPFSSAYSIAARMCLLGCIDLPHAPFHLQFDQAVHFDGVFHRQFFDERLDEAGHDHGRGFRFGHAAAHQVEELLFADL